MIPSNFLLQKDQANITTEAKTEIEEQFQNQKKIFIQREIKRVERNSIKQNFPFLIRATHSQKKKSNPQQKIKRSLRKLRQRAKNNKSGCLYLLNHHAFRPKLSQEKHHNRNNHPCPSHHQCPCSTKTGATQPMPQANQIRPTNLHLIATAPCSVETPFCHRPLPSRTTCPYLKPHHAPLIHSTSYHQNRFLQTGLPPPNTGTPVETATAGSGSYAILPCPSPVEPPAPGRNPTLLHRSMQRAATINAQHRFLSIDHPPPNSETPSRNRYYRTRAPMPFSNALAQSNQVHLPEAPPVSIDPCNELPLSPPKTATFRLVVHLPTPKL